MNDGLVAPVITGVRPHRDRDEAVAAGVCHLEASKDRMRHDLCRKRGLPVGSGVVESDG